MKVLKQCKDAMWVCSHLRRLPSAHRPANLAWTADSLSYDFIEGVHPTSWQELHSVMQNIWSMTSDLLPIDRRGYVDYVIGLCDDPSSVEHALQPILTDALTPVSWCHGDLTLYNVVSTRHTIVLIDPGHHRGLPCREIDEAKILQSLDGFGVVYKGLPQPCVYPKMPTRRVHWSLLLSHYIRLMRHVKHEPSLNFAKQRISELTELLWQPTS